MSIEQSILVLLKSKTKRESISILNQVLRTLEEESFEQAKNHPEQARLL